MAYTELTADNSGTIEKLLTYPLTGDYYFYAKVLLGLFVVFTLTIYYEEKARLGRSNFFSAMAITSIGIIVLAYAGSLAGIITGDILIITVLLGCIFIVTWMLTTEN